MSIRARIVVAVIAAVIVFAGGGALLVWSMFRTAHAARDAAEEYVSLAARNQFDEAYPRLCGRFRKAVTPERYAEQLTGLNQRSLIMGSQAYFGLAPPLQKEAQVNIEVMTSSGYLNRVAVMRREDGEWRWCGVRGRAGPLGGARLDPRM